MDLTSRRRRKGLVSWCSYAGGPPYIYLAYLHAEKMGRFCDRKGANREGAEYVQVDGWAGGEGIVLILVCLETLRFVGAVPVYHRY